MKNFRNFRKSLNNSYQGGNSSEFVEVEERVRYAETDKMGVAHNVSYLGWFEIGRTEYCRKKQLPYREIEKNGYFFMVAEAFCRYRKPLKYDDEFIIQTSLDELSQKKAIFSYKLLKKEDRSLIAEGYTLHIVTNSKGEVCPLPKEFFEKLKKS